PVGRDRPAEAADPAGGARGHPADPPRRADDPAHLARAAGPLALLPLPGGGPERRQRQREAPGAARAVEPLGPPRRRSAPGAGGPLLESPGGDSRGRLAPGPLEAHAAQ